MPERKYRNLSMPAEFIHMIETFLENNPELGFTSMSEFVKSAIREYMKICQDFKERERERKKKKG